MSSLAQEESRSISENVTWGQRKRFADGKVSMPYQNFLGYKKGRDERPEIVPEEAVIVKRIFQEFLLGMSFSGIARGLTEDNIKTPAGKDLWRGSTVKSILQNEKYKGDALLQKRFTVDFLTKKQKLNEGEVPQYYVKNSHEGIVSDEIPYILKSLSNYLLWNCEYLNAFFSLQSHYKYLKYILVLYFVATPLLEN